ncbi:unnamed protein product [Arctogadus glacialis]
MGRDAWRVRWSRVKAVVVVVVVEVMLETLVAEVKAVVVVVVVEVMLETLVAEVKAAVVVVVVERVSGEGGEAVRDLQGCTTAPLVPSPWNASPPQMICQWLRASQ